MPSITQLQALLEKEPEDVFLNFGLAMAWRSAGETDKALEQFDATLSLDETYVAAYFQKGQLLAAEDEMDAAKSCLQKGIAVAAEEGDAHAEREMREFLETLP